MTQKKQLIFVFFGFVSNIAIFNYFFCDHLQVSEFLWRYY